MHVIQISLDHTMFATGSSIGDSVWRQEQYARVLGEMSIVVHSLRRRANTVRRVSERLVLYPTNSLSRLSLPLDAYRIASRVNAAKPAAICITQDPFATGVAGYLLRRRSRVPLSVNVFSSFFDNPAWVRERAENRFLHEIGKFVVRHADTVRVESPVERDRLVAIGVDVERIWVIPLLVDLGRFTDADGTEVRARYPDRKIVLFAGRLAPEKNLDVLVRAMAILEERDPSALLLVVGDGPERARLASLATDLGVRGISFVGVVPRESLPSYFAAADVFALPSLYEGIPTVLIECAAAGRASVATPTRNISDVLEDEVTGFVTPADAGAFAERLYQVLADPARRQSMGVAARALAYKRFDPRRTLAQLAEMWELTARARP